MTCLCISYWHFILSQSPLQCCGYVVSLPSLSVQTILLSHEFYASGRIQLTASGAKPLGFPTGLCVFLCGDVNRIIACWIYLPWEFISFFISKHIFSISSYLFLCSASSSDKFEFFKKHREIHSTDDVSYLQLFC